MNDAFAADRARMVREQLRGRGISSPAVLDALGRVPRHEFLPEEVRGRAYADHPVGIGLGQTASQPWMVARMTEAAEPLAGAKVLEIGTGCGYQAAVLAAMGARVFTIERLPELAEAARRRLEAMGVAVTMRTGDGSTGWPEEAPFDAIVVTAGAPELPISLASQLAEGGRLVVPVGGEEEQELLVVRREAGRIVRRSICRCRFVPLLGREGWPNSN